MYVCMYLCLVLCMYYPCAHLFDVRPVVQQDLHGLVVAELARQVQRSLVQESW